MEDLIKTGDRIFILYDVRRQWIRTVQDDKDFHCDKGFLHFDDLIGHPYGHTYRLQPNNNKVAVLRPLASDIIFRMKRESQIIYPEDIGTILCYANIRPGSKIVEAGTGSGTVTGILAHYCSPQGHVYSFDIRENALDQARKNVVQMGMENVTTLQMGNILEDSFDFTDIDFVMLDLATPWDAVANIIPYLHPQKGKMCLFSPTLEQVKKNVLALSQERVPYIRTIELMKRFYQVKPNATRPLGRMVGHTGFMTSGALTPIQFEKMGYTTFYSPENIGNLLVYAQITSSTKVLLITVDESPMAALLQNLLKESVNMTVISVSSPKDQIDKSVKQQIHTVLAEISSNSSNISDSSNSPVFPVILIDNLELSLMMDEISALLINGGMFCAIHAYIEGAREFHFHLKNHRFYDISTSELIKREIVVDLDTLTTSASILPNTGYISMGRKIQDNIVFVQGPTKKSEKVEMILDVGRDLET
ncbi:MAG: methyltransferase domain-containing protein [Promethearchaeota archaeon]|nr:MAG: methyltransferase domain-containing protein [Candidatus Lokiarchaeota archaeon]